LKAKDTPKTHLSLLDHVKEAVDLLFASEAAAEKEEEDQRQSDAV
jgi:hypothetical protein